MAQFDAVRVAGGVIVLDCQTNFLADVPTRFVVPLRATGRIDLPRPTPVLDADRQRPTMLTPLARSINKQDIPGIVARLSAYEHEIKGALDMLVAGF